jgi:ABC-type branched-subunit amino acid transport system substrate-binding protein
VAGVSLALASCGVLDQLGGGDGPIQLDAKVAVLVPEGTASGEGVVAAVEAAIAERTAEIPNWTVVVEVVDDVAEDDELADVARQIVSDNVVAVIGGLSTDVVRAVQPVFDSAKLLFLSPADAVPEHVRGADPANPLRPYTTYFRTTVESDTPVRELARHAAGTLGLTDVAVIDAGDPGEADQFAATFRELGGDALRVDERDRAEGDVSGDENSGDDDGVGADGPDNDAGEGADAGEGDVGASPDDDVVEMLAQARDEGAEAVFVSGRAHVAARVADEIANQGLDMRLLGGSVLAADDFLAEAGSSAEGALSVVAGDLAEADGEPPSELAELYETANSAPGAYGTAAFDAGYAVGDVLTRCLPPADSARSARLGCVGELAEVSFAGLTGEVAFDEFGDRMGSAPVIVTVRGGVWTPVDADG